MAMIGLLRVTSGATAVIGGLLVLTACGGTSSPPTKSNAELLTAATGNMKAATSYHLDADIKQGDAVVTIQGDIDTANKNTRLAMVAGGRNITLVKVTDTVYLSADDGKTYTKGDSASDPTAGFTNLWANFKPEDLDKAKDALRDGTPPTEQIDGVATQHITANAKELASLKTSSSGGTIDGTVDLWVTTEATPTVRQLKINGIKDGKTIVATLKWSKINEKFDIQPPPTSVVFHVYAL